MLLSSFLKKTPASTSVSASIGPSSAVGSSPVRGEREGERSLSRSSRKLMWYRYRLDRDETDFKRYRRVKALQVCNYPTSTLRSNRFFKVQMWTSRRSIILLCAKYLKRREEELWLETVQKQSPRSRRQSLQRKNCRKMVSRTAHTFYS
jgi:hypothetical protein